MIDFFYVSDLEPHIGNNRILQQALKRTADCRSRFLNTNWILEQKPKFRK